MDENTRAIGSGPGGIGSAQSISNQTPLWIRPGSPPAIQHHLGRKLQGMYADLPSTPVPDRLALLLTQLDGTSVSD